MTFIEQKLIDPEATVQRSFEAGVESGLSWTRMTDNWWPGGPTQHRANENERRNSANANWVAYCTLTQREYVAFHEGFFEGITQLLDVTTDPSHRDRLNAVIDKRPSRL